MTPAAAPRPRRRGTGPAARRERPHLASRGAATHTRATDTAPADALAPPSPPPTWIARHGVLAVFLLALLARAVYLLELRGSLLFELLLGDARRYDQWARGIAAGDWMGKEVFYQAPLYPYFLAVLYRLAGHSLGLVRAVQSLFGAASCALVCLAGRRLVSPLAGFAAGVLLALYPPAIFFDGLLQKSALDLLFMSLLVFLVACFATRPRAWQAFAGGVLLGAFSLTRENALALLPLAALGLGWRAHSWRRRLAWVALFALGAALPLLPVALRNRAVGGEVVVTTAQGGTNFYIGNHPGASGRYEPLRPGRSTPELERRDATELAEAAAGHPLTARGISAYWMGRGLDFVRRQPAAWAGLLARKWLLVWNGAELVDTDALEAYRDRSALLTLLYPLLGFGNLCPLAVLGAWATRRRWRELWPFYVLALGWAAAVAIFYVLGRYRYPLVPVVALFAGAGVAAAVELLRRHQARRLVPGIALAAAAAVACHWPLAGADPRATTYADLGTALAGEGRYGEATEYLERAAALDPHLAGAHLALGNVALQRGDADAAAASYRRAAELDPTDAQAENNLATVLAREGRTAEAEQGFRAAIGRDPGYAAAYGNLAELLARRGDGAGALAAARQGAELAPRDAEAHHKLGNLLAYTGAASAAEQEYRQAIALDPTAADARYKLAVLLDRRGDRAAAAELRAAAFRAAPRVARLHVQQGLAAERRGAWAEAAARYREVLAVLPDDRLAGTLLARLLAAAPEAPLRDGREAASLAQRAVATSGGRDAAALAALAAAYAEVGRFPEAYVTAVRAAKDAPNAEARREYQAEGELYRAHRPLRMSARSGR
jgi:tetratricopeptide (TPR) repeat protein